MKRVAGMVLVVLLGFAAPAYADHEGDRYDQREGCGEQGGGCNNERHENYGGAGCKYVCPSFDKSPVQDSFNIQVCVQPGSCTDDKKKSGDQAQPASDPNPACLVPFPYHCDPKPKE